MEEIKQPMDGMQLTKELNRNFTDFFREAFKISRRVRGYRIPFIKHVIWQKRAAGKRTYQEQNGTHIPPFMIYSVTQKCNLMCQGCYARHLHAQETENELSIERSEALFNEASELGISVIMLAGGEPLTKRGLIELTGQHPSIIFPLFTNGLLIDDGIVKKIKRKRNLFPIISVEGEAFRTDARRGKGVHALILDAFHLLKRNNVIFGASITLTRENFDDVLDEAFVAGLGEQGAKILFYIEYIPCAEHTEHLIPTPEQRLILQEKLESYRKSHKMLFIAFPGDEELFGGCLAAGRGFIHVGSSGNVEPCPFSPFSDTQLSDKTLKEALCSPLLKAIRDNHERLSEHQGGCALWENREWVDEMSRKENSDANAHL